MPAMAEPSGLAPSMRAVYQAINPPSSWEFGMYDIVWLCPIPDKMPYCSCLANRLPKRMSGDDYALLVVASAARPAPAATLNPLAQAVHEESGFCAKTTGVTPLTRTRLIAKRPYASARLGDLPSRIKTRGIAPRVRF
jgi:hypothetical protein